MSECVIDPRRYQAELPLPSGLARESILATLCSFSIDGSPPGALQAYAQEDCERFLHTLALIPEGPLRLLEVGANPYFTSYLIRRFRPEAQLTLLNYFGGEAGPGSQQIVVTDADSGRVSHHVWDYLNCNVERDCLPYESGAFDMVLYCEVLEHMTNDPLHALRELKRVLKPDGHIVVTTPNVARLENVARIVAGANLYDPYSGYGPYGRHNREYTRHELHHLLAYCGFTEEVFFTADVHENRAAHYCDLEGVAPLLGNRRHDLGQYLFTRCRNTGPAPGRKPDWLYRSYPDDMIERVAI